MVDAADNSSQALRKCLELHNEALWILSRVGGEFPGLKKRARTTYKEQRKRRDDVLDALGTDETPQPPAAYDIEQPEDSQAAKRLVRSVIDRQLRAYLILAGRVHPGQRGRWIRAMRASAFAQLDWGGQPTAFPGLDE